MLCYSDDQRPQNRDCPEFERFPRTSKNRFRRISLCYSDDQKESEKPTSFNVSNVNCVYEYFVPFRMVPSSNFQS